MNSSTASFQQQAALWGQLYEILVKRGVLARLVEQRLITIEDPRIDRHGFRSTSLAPCKGSLRRRSGIGP